MRLQEFEVLQHRMVGETELAFHSDALRFGLDALELDTVVEFINLDPVKHAEEIEVPPRAPELAVRRELQADILLLFDYVLDLAVLDGFELFSRDLALFARRPRLLQSRRTQKAADVIGAKGRGGSGHRTFPPTFSRGGLERVPTLLPKV